MKPIQLELAAAVGTTKPGHGGKRPGAGRKRTADRFQVAHRTRPAHDGEVPVLVTLRGYEGLPSFRSERIAGMLRSVLLSQRKRTYADAFQVVELAIHDTELQVIVEATNEKTLRSGVSGLSIAFARGLNAMLGRRGRIWSDRWNGRPLGTPKDVRDALHTMFRDAARHDPRITAPGSWPESRPRTWLLEAGLRASAVPALSARSAGLHAKSD